LGLGFGLGPDPRPKPKTQRDPDSEFNYIHFGLEINKKKEFFETQKLVGSKKF